MTQKPSVLAGTAAPTGRPVETIDVADLGPPEPLRRTPELLADLPNERVLVQYNDRASQFLFPKVADRGYLYDTVETDEGVATAVWVDPDD